MDTKRRTYMYRGHAERPNIFKEKGKGSNGSEVNLCLQKSQNGIRIPLVVKRDRFSFHTEKKGGVGALNNNKGREGQTVSGWDALALSDLRDKEGRRGGGGRSRFI